MVPSAASAPTTEHWRCALSGSVTESESAEANTRLAFSQVKRSDRERYDAMLRPFRGEIWDWNTWIRRWKDPGRILSFGNAFSVNHCICCAMQVLLTSILGNMIWNIPLHLNAILLYFWWFLLGTEQSEKCCPRSNKRPRVGLLVLHVNRPEGRKYCCVAEKTYISIRKIMDKFFMLFSGDLQLGWPHSFSCWRSFFDSYWEYFVFLPGFHYRCGSALCGKGCLLKQHIHSPLQAP